MANCSSTLVSALTTTVLALVCGLGALPGRRSCRSGRVYGPACGDSTSCSTLRGAGVGCGGSALLDRRVGAASSSSASPGTISGECSASLPGYSVMHGRVVRLDAVAGWAPSSPASCAGRFLGGRGAWPAGLPVEEHVLDLGQPLGDPVDGGRGDHQDAEPGQDQQQRDRDEGGQDAGRRRRDDEADHAARRRHLAPCRRCRRRRGTACRARRARCRALPTSSAVQPMTMRPVSAFWSGWRSSRQASSASRTGSAQASDPNDAVHDGVDHAGDRAPASRQVIAASTIAPASTARPEPVAAVRRVELARVPAQRPRGAADAVGEQHPDPDEQLADHGEDPGDRVMVRRGGPAGRPGPLRPRPPGRAGCALGGGRAGGGRPLRRPLGCAFRRTGGHDAKGTTETPRNAHRLSRAHDSWVRKRSYPGPVTIEPCRRRPACRPPARPCP